tara:strand:+ start:322 stop:627 length:306 start_codon:yes stop_codon:yes gene_type:complete
MTDLQKEAIDKMTKNQKSTVNSITTLVKKYNKTEWNKIKVSVLYLYKKGHISLLIGQYKEFLGKYSVEVRTTFVDVEINTKGNITKGYVEPLKPKVKRTKF